MSKHKQSNIKYQRVISLTALLSFIILMLSSGVLYFLPDRRFTSWEGWSFLGIDKASWDNLHINLGLLFIVVIIWHIYYNWKPIKNYLKVKKELKIFTKEFNLSALIVVAFVIGTLTMTLPFSFFVNLGNGIKAKNAHSMATPPFEYAEFARFGDFCTILGVDKKEATQKLKALNIEVDTTKTVTQLANINKTTPQKIYETIKNSPPALPSDLPIGLAHKSLSTLAKEYDLDITKAIKYLKKQGVTIKKDSRLKRIAKEHHMHPAEFYAMILASQK